MKSITRALMISLSLTAIVIFVAAVLLVVVIQVSIGKEDEICETATATIAEAITQSLGPNPDLIFAATRGFSSLKATSPTLWFAASDGTDFFEFNREQRPTVPIAIPYNGPITRATLRTVNAGSPVCLQAVTRPNAKRMVLMVAGAQPSWILSTTAFIKEELSIIAMVGAAFAAIVAAGVFLAARFVGHSISRVTRMALAVDPTAPQGSIPLDDVPVELRVLVASLNGAFDEIASFMERQRRFLGNTAHELRTPLAILRAKLEEVTDSKLKAALVLDTRRLTSLVSAMLDLARLKDFGLQKFPVNLEKITRDVLADYSPLALDQGMDLSLVSDGKGPIMVIGAEAAIRSAIANLVGNALVHAYGAKTIVARLDRTGAVSICDDGMPFSQNQRRVPAEPQGCETANISGTGLGLSIVREIMTAHDGTLTITSTPRGGTTARLVFGLPKQVGSL